MKILAFYTSTFLSVRVSQNFHELFENLSLFFFCSHSFRPLTFRPITFRPVRKEQNERNVGQKVMGRNDRAPFFQRENL